ncbi:MAG TPA: glycerophosphodiester phosphodiesterase family protein [Sphingobacterium sp.]|nr:glycerophosphodiester phosphodiesterase family protein [Sphingobacterium sp.]
MFNKNWWKTALSVFLCTVATGCFQTSKEQDRRVQVDVLSTQKTHFNLHSVEDLYAFLTYDENRYPLISAHRGGPGAGYPENALKTFGRVAEAMPVIIECDVRMSKDSVLVLLHDEELARTTNGTGRVGQYTLRELQELRLKDTEGKLTDCIIPTLKEALIWGNGKVIFTLDVKNDVPYRELAALIQETEAAAYSVVITYSANQAIALHRTDPDLMISASIKSEKDLLRLYSANIPDNRLVAFVGTSQPDSKLVKALHDHGIKIILGTIGNLDKHAAARGYQLYAEYIENGADILSTDRPFEAIKALDYYISKRNLTSPYINH